MRSVLVVCPTHKGMVGETKESVRKICARGAEFISLTEASDIAGGRSWLLSRALVLAEQQSRDVVLCVDDDVGFAPEQAECLVETARKSDVVVSGVYPTKGGSPPVMRWRPGFWLAGMGFMAVPTKRLRALATRLEGRRVEYRDGEMVWPFCESHAEPRIGMWLSEDYDFCAKLGGVRVVPVSVSHYKLLPLTFGDADVDELVARQFSEPEGGFLGWKYEGEVKRDA